MRKVRRRWLCRGRVRAELLKGQAQAVRAKVYAQTDKVCHGRRHSRQAAEGTDLKGSDG